MVLRVSGTLNALSRPAAAPRPAPPRPRGRNASVRGRRLRAGRPRRACARHGLWRDAAERDPHVDGSTPSVDVEVARPPRPARTRTTPGRGPCGTRSGAAKRQVGQLDGGDRARRARARCRARRRRRAAGGSRSAGSRAHRPARGRPRRRRARPARPPCRTGCTATQCSEAPRIAWSRCRPPIAEQPVPGSRLLHGVVTSWKYDAAGALQEVPARGRQVPQLAGGAGQERLRQHRITGADGGSAARSLLRTPAPIRRTRPPAVARRDRGEGASRPLEGPGALPPASCDPRGWCRRRGTSRRAARPRGRPRSSTSVARSYANGIMTTPPARIAADDVDVGAAPAEVAAHPLTNFLVGQLERRDQVTVT